jgi:hypothetical protein
MGLKLRKRAERVLVTGRGEESKNVDKTPGYCWPTYFKVLAVLFLGEVSSAFLPSKQAYWTHQLRHLGVGQQYPPVICTRCERGHFGGTMCTEIPYTNECRLDWVARKFLDSIRMGQPHIRNQRDLDHDTSDALIQSYTLQMEG